MELIDGKLFFVSEDDLKLLKNNPKKFWKGVTEIGTGAFQGLSELKSIQIPNGIKSIGKNAFRHCESLKDIEIPESVLHIGEYAFNNCKSLKNIKLPNSIKSIDVGAFSHCKSLEGVVLPKEIKDIDDYLFYECTSLKTVDIPESVTTIGDEAFKDCQVLENLIIPNGVKFISDGAFKNCIGLKNINIPGSVIKIEDYAFCGCKSLKNVEIQEGIKTIGEGVFSECSNLESVTLPNSLKLIDISIFINCEKLDNVVIPKGIKEITNFMFSNCISLKNIIIPKNITAISAKAFFNCESLENIEIPKSVKNIELHAFYGCSKLKNIKIPESVDYIGNDVFYNCKSLKNVSVYSKYSDKILNIDPVSFGLIANQKILKAVYKDVSQSQLNNISNLAGPDSLDVNMGRALKANLVDYYVLCSVLGAFEPETKTIKLNQSGKLTTVPVKDVAYTFLQGAFNRKELKINNMHMNLQGLTYEGFNEEFLKFILNKTNFSQLATELKLLPRVYSWFLERTNLDITNIENQSIGLPSTEENRFKVLSYKTAENGIDRLKWLAPTMELLKKEFAERKFKNITNERSRELAEELAKHSIYEQKHFDKAVEIDKERAKSGVKDILNKKISQNRIASLDEYRERTKQLNEKMLADSSEILKAQLDDTSSVFTYETLEKSDPANFAIGCYTNCCATLYGAGGGAMRAMIIHPDIQPMAIRDFNGNIVSFGIIYVNRKEGYAVVNDFELNNIYSGNDDKRKAIYDKAMEGIDAFVKAYNKQYPDKPIKKVTCGCSPNWLALNDFIEQNPQSKILKAPDFDDFKYAGSGSWSGDWHNSQYTIWSEDNQNGKER